jgi:nucleotidyltransferase substrate binding protein (TIGR01987 family)
MSNLEQALLTLEEALQEDSTNSLMVDGTIHRFELTMDLYWKTLKRILLSEGIETSTPKETLKEAYQACWINNEKAWLQMIKDRNQTSHTYDEETALKILENIKSYFPEMNSAFEYLKQKVRG